MPETVQTLYRHQLIIFTESLEVGTIVMSVLRMWRLEATKPHGKKSNAGFGAKVVQERVCSLYH